jgi:hypothetical protein
LAERERLTCQCGKVSMAVTGQPFLVIDCVCNSCRKAGAILQFLPNAPPLLDEHGATRLVLFRKDRAVCDAGHSFLKEHRLKPDAPTRRVVATCCNTPMFLDFIQGSWIDMFGSLWKPDLVPPATMRLMTADLPKGTRLPDDIPNAKGRPFSIYWKIMVNWAAMRFRTAKLDYVKDTLDVGSH